MIEGLTRPTRSQDLVVGMGAGNALWKATRKPSSVG